VKRTAREYRRTHAALRFAAIMLMVSGGGSAQMAGGEFEIREAAATAGGGWAAQADFELHGSVGQAHVNASSGGSFQLFAGLWTPDESDFVFRDSWEN